MIDNEASALIEATQQEKQPDMIRFATVVGTFEDTGAPIIQFAGDTEPSQKSFAYMAWYSPTVGDTVVCMRTGNSYFILGNVNYKVAPQGDIGTIIDDKLKDKKYLELREDGSFNVTSSSESDIKKLYCSNYLTAAGTFKHGGGYIGFFGHAPATRSTIHKASSGKEVTSINELIDALKKIGLIEVYNEVWA